jgi:anti-anti-sigma factor
MEFYYSDVDKDILIVCADGGLNSDNANQFVDELGTLIEGGQTKIVVDCTRLDYISSYGVGVLLRLHAKLAKRGGNVKLACVKSIIEKFNSLFEIYPDVSRACLMFRPKDTDFVK